MRGGEDAALLHGVVEHGQNGRRAGSADRGEAHRLEDLAHAVAHGGRRRQGEVGHAERQVQALGDLVADDLAHAGDLVGRVLDDLGGIRDREVVALGLEGAVKRLLDDAWTRDAHVDHDVGLAHAEVGARHERHVLRNIAEDDELGAADGVTVGRGRGHVEDALAHELHGVHVDAGLGRAHVDRGTDAVRGGKGLGKRVDEVAFSGRHALFNERTEAADEVDAHVLGAVVEHAARLDHLVAREARADGGHRAHRNSLVDDGNAVAVADDVAGFNELLGVPEDLAADLVGERVEVGGRAVEERDTHRDGSDIEVFRTKHGQSRKDFRISQHVLAFLSSQTTRTR